MCAKWADKEEKIINLVEALIVPIRNQFGFDKNGKLNGWNVATFIEYSSAIESYIELNPEIPEPKKNKLVSNAIWAAQQDNSLDAKNLLKYIGKEEREYLKQPKEIYKLFTSLSIKYFEDLNKVRSKPNIKFLKTFPKQLDIKKLFSSSFGVEVSEMPSDYTVVRITVTARNAMEAYRFGMDAIDFLRGIWNWYYEPTEYIFSNDFTVRPTNHIRVGPYHLIVRPDGRLHPDYWYDTDFYNSAIDISKNWEKLLGFEQRSRRKINRHLYRSEIEKHVIKFAQSLDHKDKNTSFLQLWQLLEKLTGGISNSNYDQLIKRVSFLYDNVDLQRGILNHLRIHRNASIHDGRQTEQVRKYVYQLKKAVQEVLGYHIDNPFKAAKFSEAVKYLDLPTDKIELTKQIESYKKALRFRTPK